MAAVAPHAARLTHVPEDDESETAELDDIEDVAREHSDGDEPRSHRSLEAHVRLAPASAAQRRGDDGAQLDDARQERVPGCARVWVKTFGCAHNTSDGEYMAGQLQAYGYELVDDSAEADLWLINTCTVKSPSQSAMDTLLNAGRAARKALLVAGCVPQGDRNAAALEGLSLLGVAQIDRVVEAASETLKGNTVRLLGMKKTLPALDLPKVRRNAHVEIVPLSTGCLGSCTYCKTVHARGKLGSYSPDALAARVAAAVADGVTEIWLSSEDTGAYGRDLGTDLSELLARLLPLLPPDGRTMLRLGMTNPPFILHQLEAVAAALAHPCVYSCIHLPVQSGSDAVLSGMRREYTVAEFCTVVDALSARVPGLGVHTDVICGFPGETEEDFAATLALVERYRFPVVNISQFYPRPGTPAARMRKVASQAVKARSRALTALHESYRPHAALVGTTQRAWFTETAADGVQLAGRTKGGVQVLAAPQEGLLGGSAMVRITAAGRWSVHGEVLQLLTRCDGAAAVAMRKPAAVVSSACGEADCYGGEGAAECCGGGAETCCAGEASAATSPAAAADLDAAPAAPATPVSPPPRKAALAAVAAAPSAAKVSAAAPFATAFAAQQQQQQPEADWYEAALWVGVLLSLGGVFCAGVMHLAQQ